MNPITATDTRSAAQATESWPLSPVRVVVMTAVLVLLIALLCLRLATQQPWLGLDLQRANVPGELLTVVRAQGPSAAVPPGALLVALRAGGERLTLDSGDAAPEPDMVHVPYAEYAAFFARQQRIAAMLASPSLQLELADGQVLAVQPAPQRPLRDLPFTFWLQVLAGLSSVFAGGGLLAFRHRDPAVRYCVLAGAGVMLAATTAAIYTTRELALPAALFVPLAALNHLGACLSCAAFVATIWLYPRPLTARSPGPALVILGTAWWLGEQLRLLPTGAASSTLLVVIGYAVAMVLAVVQWRRSRGDLRARAALQWFLLSWLGGGGLFVCLVLVPALLGHDAGDLLPYAFGMLMFTVLGLTLGVARYRLFDLERWSFRLLVLIAGAFTVLLLDLLLVTLLPLTQEVALPVSLLVAGWLYFPLRQWLSQRLFARTQPLSVSDIPELLRHMLVESDGAPDQLLPHTLNRLFKPLHLERLEAVTISAPRLVDDGLGLRVPGLAGAAGWELRLAANGQRLFNPRDLSLAAAVLAVLERFVAHRSAIERSVEQERLRVAQDLHDDVGARLLTLLHRSRGESADAIRDTLESLRQSVYALAPDRRDLAEALASLRAEAAERCDAAGVALHWQAPAELAADSLRGSRLHDLIRILREAISNALRHAQPTQMELRIEPSATHLQVSVEHDGRIADPATWRPGVGLRSMRGRAQRLGGALDLSTTQTGLRLCLQVPLHPSGGPT